MLGAARARARARHRHRSPVSARPPNAASSARAISPTRRTSCERDTSARAAPFTVDRAIRPLVRFERRDLLGDAPPHGPHDLIVCRNVMIYFDRDTPGALVREVPRRARAGRVSRARKSRDAARARARALRAGRRARTHLPPAMNARADGDPRQGRRLCRRRGRHDLHDRPRVVRRDRAVRSRGARRRTGAHPAAERVDVARPLEPGEVPDDGRSAACSTRCAASARAPRGSARRSSAARACSATCCRRAASTSASATSSAVRDSARRRATFRSSPRIPAATTAAASISFSPTVAWKCGRCARDRVSSDSAGKPRVLIVDDSAFMRRVASQIIEELGGVRRGRHGAKRARRAAGRSQLLKPDIVTLDVDMPEMDGLTALGYIMSESPRPVVMLSAGTTGGGQEATLRALELGAVDFVLKPSGSISLDLAHRSPTGCSSALRAASTANLRGAPRAAARRRRRRPAAAIEHAGARDARRRDRVVDRRTARARGDRAAAARVALAPRCSSCSTCRRDSRAAWPVAPRSRQLDARSAKAEDGEPVTHGHVYVAPGRSTHDACAMTAVAQSSRSIPRRRCGACAPPRTCCSDLRPRSSARRRSPSCSPAWGATARMARGPFARPGDSRCRAGSRDRDDLRNAAGGAAARRRRPRAATRRDRCGDRGAAWRRCGMFRDGPRGFSSFAWAPSGSRSRSRAWTR